MPCRCVHEGLLLVSFRSVHAPDTKRRSPMSGYALEGAEAFASSREGFAEVAGWLAGEEAAGLEHGELEAEIEVRGREVLRRMLQDHLALRALREERRQDVVADQVLRTRAEKGHERPLTSVFGEVRVSRLAYRAPGCKNAYPLDAELNLPEEKQSHGLRKRAVTEAVRGSYDEAAAAIGRQTGVRLGRRQVQELVLRGAADVDTFYAARQPSPAGKKKALALTADGKGIVMRPGALRPATAKAAAGAERKLATRLSPGEKRNRKRMAEIAGVYDFVLAPRTAADIITPPGQQRKQDREPGPEAESKWLTASVTDDIPAVIAAAFDEAGRRDPDRERTWIALVDGNNTQIEAIEAEAGKHGTEVTILIDFIHVAEYIWKAAWSFFSPGDPDAEQWVAGRLLKILDGHAAQVAAGIRRRATTYGYSGSERTGADECAAYLTAKVPYLDYATALASGWPIATGIIEGACRHIIKDRFDITGARWGLEGAEALLKLRALTANGDFEDYWDWHLRREHERIHQSRYGLAA